MELRCCVHLQTRVEVVPTQNSAKEVEIGQLQKSLVLSEYTKSAVFVSKDEAAEEVEA